MLNSIVFETPRTRKVIFDKRLLEKWVLKSQIGANYQQWQVPATKIQTFLNCTGNTTGELITQSFIDKKITKKFITTKVFLPSMQVPHNDL